MRKMFAGIGGAALLALPTVAYFEGKSNEAYLDPIGIPTVCYGFTHGVELGQVYSDKECEEMLASELVAAQRILEHYIKTPMSNKTKASFISFIYNTGVGRKGVKDGFVYLRSGRHSTMYRKLRAGDIRGACEEFPKWKRAGGKVFNGLIKRRAAEKKLCLEGLES